MKSKDNIEFLVNKNLCKGCGICYQMCPKAAISTDNDGKADSVNQEECILCMLCETRCPDFAIRIGRAADNE